MRCLKFEARRVGLFQAGDEKFQQHDKLRLQCSFSNKIQLLFSLDLLTQISTDFCLFVCFLSLFYAFNRAFTFVLEYYHTAFIIWSCFIALLFTIQCIYWPLGTFAGEIQYCWLGFLKTSIINCYYSLPGVFSDLEMKKKLNF